MDWNSLLQEVSSLVATHADYDQRLGELAYLGYEQRGLAAYEDLAKAVEDMEGRKISPKTLKNKAWVYKNTKDLGLPVDTGFGLRQQLASLKTKTKKKFTQMLLDGFSNAEVTRLVKEFKGVKPKQTICPSCGATL